jgi:hypothetical protein
MGTKTADREHAKTYRSPFGRWDVTAPAFMAQAVTAPSVADVPLRVVAENSMLRNIPGGRAPKRPVNPNRINARERALRAVADATPKAPMTRTSVSTVAAPAGQRQFTYAEVDALAAKIPAGRYALPRAQASEAGNTVTFFEVQEYRGRRRIVQLVGSIGTFAQQTLKLHLQFFALTHIAADPKAAAVLFGHETNTCGRCGSPLTNDASRARGLGPKCAQVF